MILDASAYYQTYMSGLTTAQQGLFVVLANVVIMVLFYILNWFAALFET